MQVIAPGRILSLIGSNIPRAGSLATELSRLDGKHPHLIVDQQFSIDMTQVPDVSLDHVSSPLINRSFILNFARLRFDHLDMTLVVCILQ
jgi:hypothetical protein